MMRKKNKTLAVFLFILYFFFFPQSFSAQSKINSNKYTDYCTLINAENPDSAEEFRIKAFMSYSTVIRVDGGDTFFYLPKCNGGDYFSVADFSNLKDSNKKWSSFFNNLPKQKNFIFEVDFTGTIESSLLPVFGHLGWSRAEIKLTGINSIRNVSNRVKKPNYKAETPLADLGTSLRDTNSNVLFFILLGTRFQPDPSPNIAEDFILTDPAGNAFTKKSLPEFFAQNPFGKQEDYHSLSAGGGEANRINNQYKVVGIVTFTDNQDKTTKMRYENLFDYKNENWLLIKSKLSIL